MNQMFRPGEVWLDTDGKPIQAHGGGVLHFEGVYYWFGEDKSSATDPDQAQGMLNRADVVGMHCYSSRDLYNWQDEGLALPAVKEDAGHDLHPSRVAERPKVIYNARTRKFVMWLHVDSADYAYARAGVAIADQATGPYRYLGSMRPNGGMSRDQTLFQDGDGSVYHYGSSENNATMHAARLAEDALQPLSGKTDRARIFRGLSREAPAVFTRAGAYYMITSGCTGWDPNPAELATANSPLGPWRRRGNPCVGPGAEITFRAQSTFVLPVAGRPGAFIFMADIWKKENLGDSRYVWLPVRWRDNGKIEIEWMDEWDLGIFE